MPGAQTAKAQFSFGAAAKAHSKDQTTYGVDFTKLPGGISSAAGRAQVFSAAIGEYKSGANVGKKFVRLAATVLEPRTATKTVQEFKRGGEHGPKGRAVILSSETVPVRGLQTSVMYCIGDDNRGTAAENVASMLNELRRTMGDDSFTAPFNDCKTEEQSWAILEALLKKVAAEKPIIKFSTSDLSPTAERPGDPPVFENWHGRADKDEQLIPASTAAANGHAAGAGVKDKTAAAPATANGQQFDETNNPALVNPDPASDSGEVPADDDWDGWVEVWANAEEGSDAQNEAVDKLTAMAVASGADPKEVEEAADWDAVKALMEAAGGETADGEPTPEAEYEPAKGDAVYAVIPKDPKNPKKGKAKTELIVETVNKTAKTITAKVNTTKAKVVDKDGKALAIPFAELSVD